jgi:hypothetical protein
MLTDRRSRRWLLAGLLPILLLVAAPASAADHRLGVGAHFWRTVDDYADDLFEDVEDDGFAWVLSYRYDPAGLINFQIDLEYFDGGFGVDSDEALSPIGYVLFGNKLYGGIGVGVVTTEGLGVDVSDPFFAARIGYEIGLLPGVRLDLNANYRADAFEDLDGASTDAVTLGAVVRFKL